MTTPFYNHEVLQPSIAEGQLMMADGNAATFNAELTVRQLVAEQPRRARVFEQYDLPYCCCGGNSTLSQACARRGIDAQSVLRDLDNLDACYERNNCTIYRGSIALDGLQQLGAHLVSEHHQYLREELPRLSMLIGRVIRRHSELYPELWELQDLCDIVEASVERHIAAEENLMALLAESYSAVPSHHALYGNQLVMELKNSLEKENNWLDTQLALMRTMMTEGGAPESACNTYHVLLESAAEIDTNLRDYLQEIKSVLRLLTECLSNRPFSGCEPAPVRGE